MFKKRDLFKSRFFLINFNTNIGIKFRKLRSVFNNR